MVSKYGAYPTLTDESPYSTECGGFHCGFSHYFHQSNFHVLLRIRNEFDLQSNKLKNCDKRDM